MTPSYPMSRSAFNTSLVPMLMCDDARCCVDVNAAASLFMRLPREAILGCRLDELVPAELASQLDAMWPRFLRPNQSKPLGARPVELVLPDGHRVEARLSVSKLEPDRNVVTIRFPAEDPAIDAIQAPVAERALTAREREVLTLVAAGNTGVQIASQLFLAPATVQTHVANALVKLEAKNRAHGIAKAILTGEIEGHRP